VTYEACIETILDQTEATIRARIAELPDGSYPFTDHLDDFGPRTDPLRVQVTVTVDGDELAVDFAGTSPQTESGLNSYFNYTCSYVFAAIKSLTDPYGPMNAGALRPITITAPEGCFLNPRRPAGGGPRAIICYRTFEAIIGALAPAIPERVTAANAHFANPTWGGFDPRRGRNFVAYELVIGGTGARAAADGAEAMASAFNASNIPVEAQEANQPIVVERFGLIPDSGGPGRFRGGCGIRRDMRFLADDVRFTNLSERQRFPPYGLFGGRPGALGRTLVGDRVVGGKASEAMAHGDVVSFQLAGGGGYGDPLDRDPAAVEADVRRGLVSPEAAERDYGVVVGDAEATARLRSATRSST
jgi:N-methylhydantoinase B